MVEITSHFSVVHLKYGFAPSGDFLQELPPPKYSGNQQKELLEGILY